MEAIILAGGLGKRLRKLVADCPKPMALVAGVPFLQILLDELIRNGFTRCVIAVSYKADMVIKYFGNRYQDLDILYSIEDSPLGTGGATRLALCKCTEDHIYIFNGDTFISLKIAAIEQIWISNQRPILITRSVPDVSRYGAILVKNNRLFRFDEKGTSGSGLISAGCYIFPPHILDSYPLLTPFSLELDFFPSQVSIQHIDVFVSDSIFIDIGVPDDYMKAQLLLSHYR